MITLLTVLDERYPDTSRSIATSYERANGLPLEWATLTRANLHRFAEYLCERYARTTARTYCAQLRATLNLYTDTQRLPNGWAEILRIRKDISEAIYLTAEEIIRLSTFTPPNDTHRIVLRSFLIGCCTGARHSDQIDLTRDNIHGEQLIYVSKKTRTRCIIPVSPMLRHLLNADSPRKCFGSLFDERANEMNERTICDNTYNKTMRNICRLAGITDTVKLYRAGQYSTGEKWQFVSSHTARRSFATNLYIRGADLYSISKLMGHSSVTMTERYIVCGLRDLPDEVMRYFQTLK